MFAVFAANKRQQKAVAHRARRLRSLALPDETKVIRRRIGLVLLSHGARHNVHLG
jgi:hypothetical protein